MKQTNSNNGGPPRWAITFFQWFCKHHLADAALGDFLELYERRRKRMSKKKADLFFLFNVFQFLQPFAINNKKESSYINTADMFKSYLTIGIRSMSKQKMYSLITIGGFALGLSVCIVIFLFIRTELSFDSNLRGTGAYRIYNEMTGANGDRWTSIPSPVAAILKDEFPEFDKVGRLMDGSMGNMGQGGANLFRRDDTVDNNFEEGFVYMDPELLDILNIKMVYGTVDQALSKPMTIVISKRKADQYFPNEDPTGKLVVIGEDKTHPYTIGGVMEDRPLNSHFQHEFLITLKEVEFWPGEQANWCCWNYRIFAKLRPDVDPLAVEKKMLSIRDNQYIDYLQKNQNQIISEIKAHFSFRLQPAEDIYLQPEINDGNKHGDLTYIWLFGGIATFILLLACINFINLSTARSANRAKEVGLRKTVGSHRMNLITQFLTESTFYSVLSFILALILVVITLPWFNQMAGRNLSIPWLSWWFPLVIVGSAIFIGILSGIYPSFYLSSFRPIDVLKGSLSLGSKSSLMRSGMVVFQFTTTIVLIVGTIVIYRQMEFILNRDTGFDKEGIVLIEGIATLENKESFRSALLGLSNVEGVTLSGYLPVSGTMREGYAFYREGRATIDQPIFAQKWRVDPDYVATMGMKLLQGRSFDNRIASDSSAMIINQTMAAQLGLKNPVGEHITNGTVYNVIGVVEDFNFQHVTHVIRPVSFVQEGGGMSIASVRVKGGDMTGTIQSLQSVWKQFLPHQPFRYSFMDDRYAKMYEDLDRTGRIFSIFASLAIIVACLGLFALSAFMIEQRGKEISIRLVLGAPVKSIFNMLTKDFVKLVLISLLIAIPLSWYGMHRWLQQYSYKTMITWDIFLYAAIIGLVVALLTVSYQSLKAAAVRPVEGLKRE